MYIVFLFFLSKNIYKPNSRELCLKKFRKDFAHKYCYLNRIR